jgi:hypothetical protein
MALIHLGSDNEAFNLFCEIDDRYMSLDGMFQSKWVVGQSRVTCIKAILLYIATREPISTHSTTDHHRSMAYHQE